VARCLVEVLELATPAIEHGNLNAITDGGTGAELALAALQGASMNIRVNLSGYRELPEAKDMLAELGELHHKAEALIQHIRTAVAERGGLAPL
jgi:glutamate formiminotransferase/formiminotetrahydrofolate cyclodeaminase